MSRDKASRVLQNGFVTGVQAVVVFFQLTAV